MEVDGRVAGALPRRPDRVGVASLLVLEPDVQHRVAPGGAVVGNISTGDELQTQIVIDCGALPCLLSMLSSVKKGTIKEACWTLSNITAGNSHQIQAVIDANIVPALINLLLKAEYDIKKEAAWAISNLTSGGKFEKKNKKNKLEEI